MLQKYLMIFIFVLTLYMPLNAYAAATSLGPTCLNEDGIRELDFRYTAGVEEFDELNKLVYVTITFDAEDEDEQTEPFKVYHRDYPNFSSNVVHIIEKTDKGYYDTEANQRFPERRTIPIPNFPINLWPLDTYKIPMFLEFDKDVKLCYLTFDDVSSDIHAYKAGYFPENPDWKVDIVAYETNFEEIRKIISDAEPRFDNSVIFQLDTTISHTETYQIKNTVYFFLVASPILLMIAHLIYFKNKGLNLHIAFFAGVSVLLLTSITTIIELTPIDLTMIEVISFSSMTAYAIAFAFFLHHRHFNEFKKRNDKEQREKNKEKHKIQSLPYKLDED